MSAGLAIFDMDGTLVEFAIDSKAARADVIAYFATAGIPERALDIKNSILDLFTRARVAVQESGMPEPDWSEVRARVLDIIGKYEQAAIAVSKPMPGIQDALASLARAGVAMAVCTLNTTANALAVLDKHGIARHFAVVAGRDAVGDRMKPDPGHGTYIVERLDMHLDKCVMIGDHPADIQMAMAMGIKAIAISSARHGPGDFARFPGVPVVPDDGYQRLPREVLKCLGH